ncbi:MAG: cytochrome c3 family protein [Nitrospirae bacterium]|nr:cytochrome c3 family protein [Nitrospirota bacterium]
MKKKYPVIFHLLILSFFFTCTSNFSYAFANGCITAACHSNLDKTKFVHGPVAAGECAACHGDSKDHAANPKKSRFKAITDVGKKCYECHDTLEKKKKTHAPVQDGECTACHDPHGSSYKFQLKKEGSSLCFDCHDDSIVGKKFVHGPAAVGGCVACHEPHTANFDKNLKAKSPELCYSCHTDKADMFKNAQVIHPPVEEDCLNCHNPHSNDANFMLPAAAPELCFECHTDMKEWVNNVATKHGAISQGKSCLNCHEAHVSAIPKMLAKPPMDLCLGCHDKDRVTTGGVTITNLKKLLADNKDHHGPIKQKDCSGCHNTHGSDNFRMLRAYYPSTFYAPFSMHNYGLCFSCHEESIVKDPETTTLTNFRNGKINLHFKHVNKPDKGRVCRSCHETHASNHLKHIRDAVPFGSWEVPLNFNKTNDGGSCLPGCHKIKKYNRAKMEINE